MSEREPKQQRTEARHEDEDERRKDAATADLDPSEEDAEDVKGGGTRLGSPGYGGGYGGY